jgi:hypothetical protein
VKDRYCEDLWPPLGLGVLGFVEPPEPPPPFVTVVPPPPCGYWIGRRIALVYGTSAVLFESDVSLGLEASRMAIWAAKIAKTTAIPIGNIAFHNTA